MSMCTPRAVAGHAVAAWALFLAVVPRGVCSQEDENQGESQGYRGVRSAFLHPASARFYVADLPTKYTTDFVERWQRERNAVAGSCDSPDTSVWGMSFSAPLGKRVKGGPFEVRSSNQFDLDMWLFTQLLQSPLRVHSFAEADVVFVPGMFARLNRWCFPDEHADIFEEFLEHYPSFLPNTSIKPHVIGYSRTGWDNYRIFEDDERALPFTWTTIELMNSEDHEEANQRLVPLPYPAHFHWSRGSGDYFAPFDAQAVAASKSVLVSESFVTRIPERALLKEHCDARREHCRHAEFNEYTVPEMQWDPTGVLGMWNLTQQSWYCLQPIGDTFTRRAFWDCLLGGAIPVVFDESYFKYHTFQGYVDWRELLVFIPWDRVAGESGNNTVDLLLEQHSEQEALAKLQKLHEVRHLMQYSLNPVHELVRFDMLGSVQREDDAFSAGLRAVLANLCTRKLLPDERCGGRYHRRDHHRSVRRRRV